MFNRLTQKAVSLVDRLCSSTRHKHIAFILKGKRIVCIESNKCKTHPEILKHPYNKHCANTHAELAAVIKYGQSDCSEETLVVLRLKRDSALGNSKPCSGCQHVIRQVGFKEVYYSNETGSFSRLHV